MKPINLRSFGETSHIKIKQHPPETSKSEKLKHEPKHMCKPNDLRKQSHFQKKKADLNFISMEY